jgi:hypothetical protein
VGEEGWKLVQGMMGKGNGEGRETEIRTSNHTDSMPSGASSARRRRLLPSGALGRPQPGAALAFHTSDRPEPPTPRSRASGRRSRARRRLQHGLGLGAVASHSMKGTGRGTMEMTQGH